MFPSNTKVVAAVVSAPVKGSSAPIADPERSNEPAPIAQAVPKEHAELDKTATRLRELCVSLCGNQGAADPGPAALLIEEFEFQLIPHFTAEEAEEFFGSLVTDQPSLLRRVDRLQAEHGELADALEQLLEFSRNGPPGPELAARLGDFLRRFDTHEHAENALMQEFFLLDQGGGGE